MPDVKKISSIEVHGLQEMFNYKIDFNGDGSTVILIAPNGFGKTAFLSLINSCLQFRLIEAANFKFKTLSVVFEDKTKWLFEKKEIAENGIAAARRNERDYRIHARRRHRHQHHVKYTYFDAKGKPQKDDVALGIESIPRDLLVRTLDRNLPISRISSNNWRDLRTGEVFKTEEIVDIYREILINDLDVQDQLGEFSSILLEGVGSRLNCVFIETQRLLQNRKVSRGDPESVAESQEEILRQAEFLAKLLQRIYASYAATSQDLDRSFPNRLIARSEKAGPADVSSLKQDLNDIEARRKALTDAGILVETSELVIAPKDEFLPNVSHALQIYVEDSKKKLATFDEVFSKVSVFRDLFSKKLKPKELIINRERGAEVRRGLERISLDKLSSGEKHEFIMLFRLIFETPEDSVVLIDEPEISLHVSWQLEFMSDLAKMQSANRFQSIIATHSPQIIQGAEHITFDLADQVA